MENYERIKIIGKGSFGSAVLCKHKPTGDKVVVKMVDVSALDDAGRRGAMREVSILSYLEHPSIIRHLTSFQHRGTLCIVCEYAEQGDLLQYMKAHPAPFSESRVLQLFAQMCQALEYVHSKRVLHRDLKLQNIFMDAASRVKLGDFGIARVLKHTHDCAQTQIGTPYYMSPELCDGRPYNAKSDIWALGCVLYELCTRQHPFQASSLPSLVYKIARGSPDPIGPTFSRELQSLVSQMLSKSAALRPPLRAILRLPFLQPFLTPRAPPKATPPGSEEAKAAKAPFRLASKPKVAPPPVPLHKAHPVEAAGPPVRKQAAKAPRRRVAEAKSRDKAHPVQRVPLEPTDSMEAQPAMSRAARVPRWTPARPKARPDGKAPARAPPKTKVLGRARSRSSGRSRVPGASPEKAEPKPEPVEAQPKPAEAEPPSDKFRLAGATLKLCGGGDDVPLTHRLEALRAFLAQQMGDDTLLQLYRNVIQTADTEDPTLDASILAVVGPRAELVPLVRQLLALEAEAFV